MASHHNRARRCPKVWEYVYVAATLVLFYLSNRISGAETAITVISNVEIAELAHKGGKAAERVAALKSDLDRTIAMLLVTNNIVNMAIAVLVTLFTVSILGSIWVSLSVGVATFVLIIVSEITPKAYAVDNRKKLCMRNANWVWWLSRALAPLITALMGVTRGLLRVAGMSEQERVHLLVSDDAIRSLSALGVKQGMVDDVEHRIITKVLDFADARVRDLMVGREHVFTIPAGTPLEAAKKMLYGRAFTRVPIVVPDYEPATGAGPVCGGEVVGVVHVKDLIGREGNVIDDFVRPPFMVTPMQLAADLFEEMRHKRVHMALVCADDGRLMGIITLEDLVEKVMGEIHDEVHDRQFPHGEPP